jgi:hypothetical protein
LALRATAKASRQRPASAKVEALALYFDFKEFTPIGRQGDEIVRRLADRLVLSVRNSPANSATVASCRSRVAGSSG